MAICIYHRWWETANGFSKYRRWTHCVYDCWLRCKLLCNWPSIVGITKIGGRREIIWILIFMIPVVFASQWFMIPTRIQIYDSRRLLITYWLNDFLRGNLVSFSILWCSNFCFIQTWYHHSFCLGIECFCNWTLSTSLLEKRADCQPQMHELYRGSRGMFPRKKFLKIGLSETPYPAFPGSNAINSYVYFVELFSESHYSWFPSRSIKIHDS